VGDAAILEAQVEVGVLPRAAVRRARGEEMGLLAEPALREEAGGRVSGYAAVYEACEQLRAQAPPALVVGGELLYL
jgi:hypothetical protein